MEYVRRFLQSCSFNPKQSLHDFVIDTLNRCSTLGVVGILRGQIMSIEMEEEFPQEHISTLQQLVSEYDNINDSAILKDLQRSIAVTQDDAATGIRLARQVNAAIEQIRAKDALAGRILVLSNLLNIYQQDLICRHREWASPTLDEQTDRVLNLAIRSLQGGDPDVFWAELSPDDLQRLSKFLHVDENQVHEAMHAYLSSATNSLFVESS